MKNLLLVLILSSLAFNQIILTPSSIGTAGTIATQARGDDVIGWNPANLGFRDNAEFSMSFGVIPIIPIPAVSMMNSTVSLKWFADYLFSGQYLDDGKKNEMLDAFGDEGWDLNPLLYAKILGISSGDFAFTIGAEVNSNITLPTSFLEFVMYGNKFEEKISLDDIDGSAQVVIPFALSYGFPLKLPDLDIDLGDNYLGFGIKLLWGVAHAEVEEFEGGITTFIDHVEGIGNGKIKYTSDGFGLAFDIGWALKISDDITTNLSIQNMFGYIKWKDKNSEMMELTFDANIEVSDNFEDISDVVEGNDSTYAIKGYTSDYPTYLVAGIEYEMNPNVQLFMNYKQYFADQYQFSTSPRLSFAAKLSPAIWFPIRIGMSFGGFEKFQTGVGFGLHGSHYHFDIGITQVGGLFNSARGVGFAIGQKILF